MCTVCSTNASRVQIVYFSILEQLIGRQTKILSLLSEQISNKNCHFIFFTKLIFFVFFVTVGWKLFIPHTWRKKEHSRGGGILEKIKYGTTLK